MHVAAPAQMRSQPAAPATRTTFARPPALIASSLTYCEARQYCTLRVGASAAGHGGLSLARLVRLAPVFAAQQRLLHSLR